MADQTSFVPIGQPLVSRIIEKMIKTDRVGGSYLFSGPPGVGKKTVAQYLAMAVNCEASTFPPCGQCVACAKILSGNHPDVWTISFREKKQTIAIEQVRELQEPLAFPPYEGKRRVVLIDPADRLGLEAANALLVTLESPPAHTLLILITTAPYTLLPTIRSRCQLLRFTPLSKGALMEISRRAGVQVAPDDPALELCQGSATRLMALLQSEEEEKHTEIDTFLSALLKGSRSPDLIETPKWAKQRGTMEIFLEQALWLTRDWIVSLEEQTGREVVNNELIRDVNAVQGRISRASLLSLVDALFQSIEDLKRNAAPELIFDTLRMRMEAIVG